MQLARCLRTRLRSGSRLCYKEQEVLRSCNQYASRGVGGALRQILGGKKNRLAERPDSRYSGNQLLIGSHVRGFVNI